jgi:hypothetical protein
MGVLAHSEEPLPAQGPCFRALAGYGPEVFGPAVGAYLTVRHRRDWPVAADEKYLLERVLQAENPRRSLQDACRFVMEFGKTVTDPKDQKELFRLFCELDKRWPDHFLPPAWPKLGD